MNVFKPTQLLLALRMRQISIPFAFLGYFFFIEKWISTSTYQSWKWWNCQSLVENDNLTTVNAMITKPTAIIITRKTVNEFRIRIIGYSPDKQYPQWIIGKQET